MYKSRRTFTLHCTKINVCRYQYVHQSIHLYMVIGVFASVKTPMYTHVQCFVVASQVSHLSMSEEHMNHVRAEQGIMLLLKSCYSVHPLPYKNLETIDCLKPMRC